MIAAVRVAERVQGVGFVHAEGIRRNEHRAARAQRDVARAVADGTRAHSRRGIVPRSGDDFDAGGESQLRRRFLRKRADDLVRIVQAGQLRLGHAADFAHFL